MTQQEIFDYAASVRANVAKGESAIWATGTRYTPQNLEASYEGYIITALEAGENPDALLGFGDWCEIVQGIPNEC